VGNVADDSDREAVQRRADIDHAVHEH
jgi:hypothetical protein